MRTKARGTDAAERTSLLRSIAAVLSGDGRARLRRPVEVAEDFLGAPFILTVRVIRTEPGSGPESLSFAVGTSEYGDTVLTDSLSTEDIKRIWDQIL